MTRNDVIAELDAAVFALRTYLAQCSPSEAVALVDALPRLRELRAKFEQATAPRAEGRR